MKDDFEYHITFPVVKTDIQFTKDPVAILFGWAGCADKHLEKYCKVYEKEGFITVRFVTSSEIMSPRMVNHERLLAVAGNIVELMEDMMFFDNPVFFHSFSNGGGTMYRYVNEILQKDYPGKYQIKGCIFDSAPAKISVFNFFRAAFAVIKGNVVRKYFVAFYVVMQFLLLNLLNFFYQSFKGEFTRKRLWNALINEPNMCPQLFLFSKADDICNWESIQQFINHRRRKGVDVETVLWDDSPHVQHMVLHEKEYCNAISQFVQGKLKEYKNELDS